MTGLILQIAVFVRNRAADKRKQELHALQVEALKRKLEKDKDDE
jgi:hypothetical protein